MPPFGAMPPPQGFRPPGMPAGNMPNLRPVMMAGPPGAGQPVSPPAEIGAPRIRPAPMSDLV